MGCNKDSNHSQGCLFGIRRESGRHGPRYSVGVGNAWRIIDEDMLQGIHMTGGNFGDKAQNLLHAIGGGSVANFVIVRASRGGKVLYCIGQKVLKSVAAEVAKSCSPLQVFHGDKKGKLQVRFEGKRFDIGVKDNRAWNPR